MFSPYATYRISAAPQNLGAALETSKATAVLQVLGNRYPVMTGSCYLSGGCSPAMDDKADFWSFQAVSKEAAGGVDLDVYSQLQTLQPGAKALVDVASVDKVLNGDDVPIVYVIAKNSQVAQALSQGQGASLQELPVSGAGGGDEKEKGIKGSAIVGGLIAAGAGTLVGGPAVGAVAGLAVGYVLNAWA